MSKASRRQPATRHEPVDRRPRAGSAARRPTRRPPRRLDRRVDRHGPATASPARRAPSPTGDAPAPAAASASASPIRQPTFLERYRTADRRRRGARRSSLVVGVRLPLGLAAGLRLLDRLDPDPDRLAGRRRDARPRLRPARHGPPARRVGDKVDLHLLRAGVGHHYNALGQRARSRPRLRPERQRPPAGLDPQPRARRASSSSTAATARARPPRARPSCARSTTPSRTARSAASPKGTMARSSPASTRWRRRSRRSSGAASCRSTRSTQAQILAFYEQMGRADEPGAAVRAPPSAERPPRELGRPRASRERRARAARRALPELTEEPAMRLVSYLE